MRKLLSFAIVAVVLTMGATMLTGCLGSTDYSGELYLTVSYRATMNTSAVQTDSLDSVVKVRLAEIDSLTQKDVIGSESAYIKWSSYDEQTQLIQKLMTTINTASAITAKANEIKAIKDKNDVQYISTLYYYLLNVTTVYGTGIVYQND